MFLRLTAVCFISASFLFCSCQQVLRGKGVKKLDNLSWMQGTWKMQTPNGLLKEHWSAANDTLWQGYSYMTSSTGDTLFQETIELKQTEDGVHYIPTVPSQNGGQPVSFKATKVTDDEAHFENATHDFPQRIIYTRISYSSIVAAIEGKDKREEFVFTKE